MKKYVVVFVTSLMLALSANVSYAGGGKHGGGHHGGGKHGGGHHGGGHHGGGKHGGGCYHNCGGTVQKVPEINAATGGIAIALMAGVVSLMRERRKRT